MPYKNNISLLGCIAKSQHQNFANSKLVKQLNSFRYNKDHFHVHIAFNENCLTREDDSIFILCSGMFVEDSDPLTHIKKLYLTGKLEEIQEINGLFSSIIIDKTCRRAVLMTDRIGSKPIYYGSADEKDFIFSDRLKGVLSSNCNISTKINTRVFFELFHMGFIAPPDTLIEGVNSLNSSKYLLFQDRATVVPFHFPKPKKISSTRQVAFEILKESIYRSSKASSNIAVLASGGLDSSIITAILKKKLNKKVSQHVCNFGKQNQTAIKTNLLKDLYQTDLHVFKYEPDLFYKNIRRSIMRVESEAVGIISENVVTELLFSEHSQQCSHVILTGDDNMITPASLSANTPGYYSLKYQIIPTPEIKCLFNDGIFKNSYLFHIQKHKSLLNKELTFSERKAYRHDVNSTLVGKIIGKARNHQFHYPLLDTNFVSYFDSYAHYNTQNHRILLRQIAKDHDLLPEEILEGKKEWMPSIFCSHPNIIGDIAKDLMSEPGHLQTFFNIEKIPLILRESSNEERKRFVLTLLYLKNFIEIFDTNNHTCLA